MMMHKKVYHLTILIIILNKVNKFIYIIYIYKLYMSTLYTIFLIIGFIICLSIVQMVLNFFSVSFSDYSTYMFWIIALFIFSFFLPSRHLYFQCGSAILSGGSKIISNTKKKRNTLKSKMS
jgi:hypothetical protein